MSYEASNRYIRVDYDETFATQHLPATSQLGTITAR
jgi:hypothetical protein